MRTDLLQKLAHNLEESNATIEETIEVCAVLLGEALSQASDRSVDDNMFNSFTTCLNEIYLAHCGHPAAPANMSLN